MVRSRAFGRTGLEVSEIGFGCSRIGGLMASKGGAHASIRLLERAHDHGITFFDTADMYSQGEGEELLGRAFRGKRDKVIIASKGGYLLPARRRLLARVKPLVRSLVRALGIRRGGLSAAVAGAMKQDFSAPYMVRALEGSLRRLNTDYLDLYQAHSPPAETIRSGEIFDVLERLQSQGKIRHYGLAADSVDDALLALRTPGLASVQVPFGLLDLEALDTLLPEAAAQGVAVIARGAFGGGLLKPELSETQLREMTTKWPRILAARQVAAGCGRSVLECALQFVLGAEGVSVTLLGMHSPHQLEGNLAHCAAPRLSSEAWSQLRQRATP